MAKVRSVSTSRVIPASAQAIFEVLADPAQHSVIDGSGTVRGTREVPERLSLGATFGMSVKRGVKYPITNTVIEFDEGRRIAWRHFHGHIWRYELEPLQHGTKVTETFDWATSRFPRYIELFGYPKRNLADMERTLVGLAQTAVGPAAA